MTTISSREFKQHAGRAKKAAQKGPLFITDRGRPAYVLLSIARYESLVAPVARIVDLLALPGSESGRFVPRKARKLTKAADLA